MGFKSFWEKVKENKWHILILVFIFLIAMGFRMHVARYDGLIEPDAYWHARATASYIQEPFSSHTDLLGIYHKADKLPYSQNGVSLLWYISVVLWNIFTFGAAYNKDIWMWFVRLLPACYGALTSLAMYFLFRVAYKSRHAGYLAGLFAAIVPAFVYRTMSGHYEEDSMGFLWMVLGFGFLVLGISKFVETKQIKWKPIIYGLLGGLFLGIMAWVWEIFAIVPIILLGYFFSILFMKLVIYRDLKFLKGFTVIFGACFIFMVLFASIWSTSWINTDVNYVSGILGISGGSVVDTQTTGSVGSMLVGEETEGYPAFGSKYNIFLIFIISGLILGLYRIIFDRKDWFTLLILVWSVACLYLAWNKLKATFWFGLPVAALTALTMYELYQLFFGPKKGLALKVGLFGLLLFLTITGVAGATIFVHNQVPQLDQGSGWKETISWLGNNTAENAKMFNWWSEGHWITFLANRRVATDNTNGDGQALKDVPMFFIDDNAEHAMGILKAYDADYVLMDLQSISGLGVYSMYVNNTSNSSDPRVAKYQSYVLSCTKNELQLQNDSYYTCGGNKILPAQMDSFYTEWNSNPSTIINGKTPMYYYTYPTKNVLFGLSYAANNSMAAKLWFGSKELGKYLTLVYAQNQVRVYKVNKSSLANIEPQMVGLNQTQIEEWNNKVKAYYGESW